MTVSFDEFSKLDLRIGKIVEVQKIEKTDKLYLLKVDIGKQVIQLVAGLSPFYQKEELENKLIVVLANLEPRKIKGFISQGMLLAATSGDRVSLLSPDKDITVGSKII